jgi:hypothetical protein
MRDIVTAKTKSEGMISELKEELDKVENESLINLEVEVGKAKEQCTTRI